MERAVDGGDGHIGGRVSEQPLLHDGHGHVRLLVQVLLELGHDLDRHLDAHAAHSAAGLLLNTTLRSNATGTTGRHGIAGSDEPVLARHATGLHGVCHSRLLYGIHEVTVWHILTDQYFLLTKYQYWIQKDNKEEVGGSRASLDAFDYVLLW
ncbi:unnamed protein product [Phytophthora fragariaefolia]|uniref:Unnamed protein product n=1 Tax=Phytophthora fragariaefolia TaxID=1490495 RepID=A0A9W6Y3K7_9STRA|nr:unnamed protein product [Phytophthora fragariaefolia]